jgi:hypothetical protein
MGTAMFTALALGGPAGTVLYSHAGFAAVAAMTIVLPLAVLLALRRLPGVAPMKQESVFRNVARAVWLPGCGAGLCSVGYGAILAFSTLLFVERSWQPVWLPFSAFGAALIVSRIFFGTLPDRHGGARVALLFILVEAAGLLLIWHAGGIWEATAGTALAGVGYSLV